MATSSQHAADQTRLVAMLYDEMDDYWSETSSQNQFVEAATPLVKQYAQASSAVAAEHYEQARDDLNISKKFNVPLADPPPDEQVQKSLTVVTRSIAVPQDGPAADDRSATALRSAKGSAQRLVVNTGRETIARATNDDPEAEGWVREATGPTTCSFCRTMIIRGAVYKNAYQAGRAASRRFLGDGQFKFHDNDDCTARPIFKVEDYEPPEYVQDWEAQYYEASAEFVGEEKLRAFRRAVDAELRASRPGGG